LELADFLGRELEELEEEFRSGELEIDEQSFHELVTRFPAFAEQVEVLDRADDEDQHRFQVPLVRQQNYVERPPSAPTPAKRSARVPGLRAD